MHIRESVRIDPVAKGTQSIEADTTHPTYPRVGGTLVAKIALIGQAGLGLLKINEEITGRSLSSTIDSLVFRNISQWTKFVFSADLEVPFEGDTLHAYPPSFNVIGVGTSYITFEGNLRDGEPFYSEVIVSLTLTPDYSLDAIPPSDIYDGAYLVNPFEPRDLTLPTGGDAFLTIDAANPTNQGDNLYVELPNQELLVSNAPAGVGDTIALGHFQCGDPLRLYLQSGKTIVAGMHLYPEISQEGTVPIFLPDGREAQILGTLNFDDWTDLIYNKLSCTVYVVSDTSNVMVQIDPPVVSPGDTATIIVKQHGNCQVTDYPPDQLFNVGILGDSTGTILSSDGTDTASYFTNIPAGFKFIAPDSINGDSAVVNIEVGIPPVLGPPSSISAANNKFAMQDKPTMNGGVKGPKSHAKQILAEKTNVAIRRSLSVPSDNDFGCFDYGITVGLVEPRTILLGETKYYYATEDNGTLTIHETYDPSSNPGMESPSLIMEDLTIADDAVNNDKIGAYWDYLKPDGTGLDDGMIRVIGRYWKQDTTYKVRLHAVYLDDGSEGAIEITVEKPMVLGDPNIPDVDRHSVVTDVFGHPLDLDELVIEYAGENGIPPQLIKGQMEQESNFRNSWRYEPMTDIRYQEDDDLMERFFPAESPFVKSTDHPTGTGNWPYSVQPPHSNVCPGPYNNIAVTIGGYIADNWDKYKRKGKLGEPDSILSSTDLTQRFKELYKPPTKLNKKTPKAAKQEAYEDLGNELREAKSEVGQRYNRIAQTRIVTSYAFAQLMYSTTIDIDGMYCIETDGRYAPTRTPYMLKLETTQYPEKLNEQNWFMPIYSDKLLRDLYQVFYPVKRVFDPDGPRIAPSQWRSGSGTIKGYENSWKRSLHFYNAGGGYADSVMAKSQKYLPH